MYGWGGPGKFQVVGDNGAAAQEFEALGGYRYNARAGAQFGDGKYKIANVQMGVAGWGDYIPAGYDIVGKRSLGGPSILGSTDVLLMRRAPAAPAPAAPAPAPVARGSANDLPAPNDGTYGNIMTNVNHQGAAGAAEALYWKQKQADDAASYARQFEEMRAGSSQQAAAYARQLEEMKIGSGQQAAAYAKQLEEVRLGAEQNAASLRSMMLQQQQGYDQQIGLQSQQLAASQAAYQERDRQLTASQAAYQEQVRQLAASQAAYQEQVRQVGALSRAFIPTPQPTAAAPVSGDSRTASSSTASSGTNSSTLSSLSILSDLGSISPSLVGLQIA